MRSFADCYVCTNREKPIGLSGERDRESAAQSRSEGVEREARVRFGWDGGAEGRERRERLERTRVARSDRQGYLKRTFPDFTTPTIVICRSRYVRRGNATIDEDVSTRLVGSGRASSER